jgi:hypothetical protein
MALDMLEMAAGNTELDRLRGIADRDSRFIRVSHALAETNRLPVDDHRPRYVV